MKEKASMAEAERTRERERPPLKDNPYEVNQRSRKAIIERNRVGPVVITPADREVFLSRQGRLQFFLNPFVYKDTPNQQWIVFKHDIRTKSGKHRHQGGLVIYVIEGKGYSVVDDERKDWEKGDLLLLPMKPEGVEHQHFNIDPERPAVWAAFIPIQILWEYVSAELEQVEVSPEFKQS
jgi:quercetin dioxygenase-like cupin family protein